MKGASIFSGGFQQNHGLAYRLIQARIDRHLFDGVGDSWGFQQSLRGQGRISGAGGDKLDGLADVLGQDNSVLKSFPKINALERLYQGLERWPEYLEVLQQKQELCDDMESRKEVAFAIGQTYEGAVTQIARVVTADTDLLLPDFDAVPTTGTAPTLPGSLR